MKALFLLIFIAGMTNSAFCQKHKHAKIDSLLTVLKTSKENTAKVNTLNALAYAFASINPDTAIYFGNEALSHAKKLDYNMGIADAHVFIGEALDNLGEYTNALKNLNVAIKVYDKLLSSAKTIQKLKIQQGKGNAYNFIGFVYDDQSDYPEALKNYFAALGIYREIMDKTGVAKICNNIGIIYTKQGNDSTALRYHFSALKLNEELGSKYGKALNLNNIGIIYNEQGNHEEALKNHFAALKIYEELDDKSGKARTLGSIGTIYLEKRNYPEALKNYLAGLKLDDELGDKRDMFNALNNIGNVYYQQGNFTESLKNHMTALKIGEEIASKDQMAQCFDNIGGDYMKMKRKSEASLYLNKGLSLAKEVGSFKDIYNGYLGLSELDSLRGNWEKSLENYKMYITYRDSLINKESAKKMVQMQMQYEFDKKESLAKSSAQKELQRQKLIRNGFVGGSALLLIFAVILFILKYQYEKIRLIKKERNRISGELHDDIGADLTRITVISQLLYKRTKKDDEMQEKLLNISEAGNKVLGNISEIIWTMNPQKDNLESLVAHIHRFAEEYLEMNGIEVNIEFPDEIPERSVSDEYRRNIFLVIKEAIYNISKYSKATRVRLSMNLGKKSAEVEISDNGTGFSVKEKQNWGNGLRNMNQRMKDIGGNFQIISAENEGTLIRLNFPVH